MRANTLETSSRSTRSRARAKRWRKQVGLLFVLPSVAFVAVFFLAPLAMTAWMSLFEWPLLGAKRFIGAQNYAALLSDANFWSSLGFTARYTLVVTPVLFVLAFALALLVKQPSRFVGLFRTAYFLPVVIGLSTSSLLWVWLLNDQVGVFNAGLAALGVIREPFFWLATTGSAMTAIVVMVTWKMVGLTMLLLLIGMQAIPHEFYEAAKVDGASKLAQLRFITLPLMRRTFALALVLSVIGSFLAFDPMYIMAGGGPQNSTITTVYWIFKAAFVQFKLGYAAALSMVLLVILIAVSVVQLYLLRDDTRY